MTLKRRVTASALAAAAFTAAFAIFALTTTDPAQAAGAQYCIARGGSDGAASYVSNCVYSDYQQCLNVVAETRGNCVPNVEYRGEPAPTPARRPRTRRS